MVYIRVPFLMYLSLHVYLAGTVAHSHDRRASGTHSSQASRRSMGHIPTRDDLLVARELNDQRRMRNQPYLRVRRREVLVTRAIAQAEMNFMIRMMHWRKEGLQKVMAGGAAPISRPPVYNEQRERARILRQRSEYANTVAELRAEGRGEDADRLKSAADELLRVEERYVTQAVRPPAHKGTQTERQAETSRWKWGRLGSGKSGKSAERRPGKSAEGKDSKSAESTENKSSEAKHGKQEGGKKLGRGSLRRRPPSGGGGGVLGLPPIQEE